MGDRQFPFAEEAAWSIVTTPPRRGPYQHRREYDRRVYQRRRWLSMVQRTPGGCWTWTGPMGLVREGGNPYPIIHVETRPKLAYTNASGSRRSAFWFMIRDCFPSMFPNRQQSQVTCGNDRCVSPAHRRYGSVGAGNSRLKSDQVSYIYTQRGKQIARTLAEQFGVCESAVTDIWTGRTWSRVTGQKYEPRTRVPGRLRA